MDLIDPLFDAVIKGDDSIVNHVLSLGISLTVNDEDGLTVLHWAASSTEGEKLVPFLIANGAMIDAKDNFGRTPLHIHCARGRIYAVACLVYHGADTNCQTLDTGFTPLQVASSHGHDEIQRILLAYGATPPNG
eukprot:gene20029-22763_t